MSEVPPPVVLYPRGPSYGSADRLQALGDVYFALPKLFLANIAGMVLGGMAMAMFPKDAETAYGVFAICLMLVFAGIGFFLARKLAFSKEWGAWTAVPWALLIGLNALCIGVIGYGLIFSIVQREFRRYGLDGGFIGIITRYELEQLVASMRQTVPPPIQP